jgi:hypothetical protein
VGGAAGARNEDLRGTAGGRWSAAAIVDAGLPFVLVLAGIGLAESALVWLACLSVVFAIPSPPRCWAARGSFID